MRYCWLPISCLLLCACSFHPYEDPIAVMLDHGVEWRFRRRATEQVKATHPLNQRGVAAWHKLVWERGYPHWQRREAIDQLIAYDEVAFHRLLGKRIHQVTDWETLNYLFGLAVARKWSEFRYTAIRSYARPDASIPDWERPERRIIEQLNGGESVDRVAWSVLANGDQQATVGDQVAAWAVLVRLQDRDRLITTLSQMSATDPFLADLQAAWFELGVLPLQSEELLCLRYWRHPDRRKAWHLAVSLVNTLRPLQRQGLQLRHIPVLLQAEARTLVMSCEELRSIMDHTIARESSQYQLDSDELSLAKRRRIHSDESDSLSWADWVAVRMILHALQHQSVIGRFFEQADADYADRRTEYGGVLTVVGKRFEVHGYPPLLMRHDRIFYPSPEMIVKLYTGLAHYHFHAQKYQNGQYSGPGEGDLGFAQRMNANCIVLTFLNRDQLSVHYYQSKGVVIDLGVIHRPIGTG